MSHVYHPSLPKYNEEAILQDGCPECDERADKGIDGLFHLDPDNMLMLMFARENGAKSDNDRKLINVIDKIDLFLRRYMNDSLENM